MASQHAKVTVNGISLLELVKLLNTLSVVVATAHPGVMLAHKAAARPGAMVIAHGTGPPQRVRLDQSARIPHMTSLSSCHRSSRYATKMARM